MQILQLKRYCNRMFPRQIYSLHFNKVHLLLSCMLFYILKCKPYKIVFLKLFLISNGTIQKMPIEFAQNVWIFLAIWAGILFSTGTARCVRLHMLNVIRKQFYQCFGKLSTVIYFHRGSLLYSCLLFTTVILFPVTASVDTDVRLF